MEFKIMHRVYSPEFGGWAITKDKVLNDFGDKIKHYIGTLSEYNPFSLVRMGDSYALSYIRKNVSIPMFQKQPNLKGIEIKEACSHCGGTILNNGGVSFTKEELLKIANAMDPFDVFEVIQIHGEEAYLEAKKMISKVV